MNLCLLGLATNHDSVIVEKYQAVWFRLHIDGIFNAGRLDAVDVDPSVNSHGIPTSIRGHGDELCYALDVGDEGWPCFHQVPSDQFFVLSRSEAQFASRMHGHG